MTTKIRPIKAEDISPEDFSRHLKMLRWLAREQPEETMKMILLLIKMSYEQHGGPRLRERGGQ